MIQIPGLAPNPDDEENQFAPMQAPQADAPVMSLGTRAPLQATQGNTGGGGGADTPPPPPSVPGIAIMQPPEESHRTGWEKQGEQLTQKLPNEQAAQAFGDLQKAQKAENAATEREDHAKALADEAAAQVAQQRALAEERAVIQRRLAQVEWEKRREALMADEARRQQELQDNGKVTSYWDNPGAPSRVAAAFLTSLGTAFGHGSAEKELDRQLAEDRQTKLDKFTRSKEFLAMAKGNTEAAHAAYESKVKDIDREQIAQIGLLDKQLAAVTARVKIPQAQAEREKLAAQGQAKQAELQANIQAHYDKSLAGERMNTSGSDTENKAAGSGGPSPLVVRTLAGQPAGLAATKEEAVKIRDAHGAAHEVRGLALKMMEFNKEHPRLIVGRDDALIRERNAMTQALSGRLGKANETGVLSDKEFTRTTSVQSPRFWETDPEKFNSGLQAIIDMAGRGYNTKLNAQGLPTTVPAGQLAATPPTAAASRPTPKTTSKSSPQRPQVRTMEKNGKRYVNDGSGWIEL